MTDVQLLQKFVERKSQEAFTELVRRHVDWVYSVACRQVSDAHLAEDVTQAVFILAAQKARQLVSHQQFNGWLFRTTRYCAANALKLQAHRRQHEEEARAMRSEETASESMWAEIAPKLDAALAGLSGQDREAILLKFYQGKTAAEVGRSLGVNEEAAKKRLQRAVEKLRGRLGDGRADTVTLSAAVAGHATHAAPPHLAASAASAALATAHSTALAGAVAQATLKTLGWAQIKVAAALTAVVSLAAVGGYATVQGLSTTSAPVPVAAPAVVAAESSPAPAAARLPVAFDALYEKAPGSKPDLTMQVGPNTFAVTTMVRFGADGKAIATNNLGEAMDAATLPLAKVQPPVGAGFTKDVLLVQLSPERERYHIDRLRIFDHATRQSVGNVSVTPVPGMSALQIIAPPGTLPARIDLWMAVASYAATSTPVNLGPAKGSTVTIGGSTVGFLDIRDGAWNYDRTAFSMLNPGTAGDQTSLQIHATQPWSSGRFEISAVSKSGQSYLSDFFVDFRGNSSPIMFFPFGLAQIDHFELRPYSHQPPFYFDGVTLPPMTLPAVSSPIPVPRVVKSGNAAQVKLPSDVTVELVGIAHNPSAGKWWGIDGTKAEPPPGVLGASVSDSDGKNRTREFYARTLDGMSHDILWQIDPGSGWAGGGDGTFSHIVVSIPGTGPVTVRVGVGTSSWRPLEEIPAEKLPAEPENCPGTLGTLRQEADGVILTSTLLPMPETLRLVAVDKNGAAHAYSGYSSSVSQEKLPPWGMQQVQLKFQDMKVEDVAAMRFEIRKEEYAEFANVPMEPGK